MIDDGLDRSPPPRPPFSKLSPSCNGAYSGGYHYHHGLKAGEGTLEASLVRLLVRGMNKKDGAFDQDTYLEDYIKCVFGVWRLAFVSMCAMYGGGWVGWRWSAVLLPFPATRGDKHFDRARQPDPLKPATPTPPKKVHDHPGVAQ